MADKLKVTLIKSTIGAVPNMLKQLKHLDLQNFTKQLNYLTMMQQRYDCTGKTFS